MSFSPPSANKSKTIDSSYPVFFDDTSIVIPYPKESKFERISAIWAPFSSEVFKLEIIQAKFKTRFHHSI